MMNGWVGVDLFFILSGFLISQPFLTSTNPGVSRFYTNRALRIFPAYFVVLAMVIFGAFPLYHYEAIDLTQSVISHVFFIQDYTGSNLNVVLWSLGVELKFYLIAPFVLAILGRYIHTEQNTKTIWFVILLISLSPILRLITYIFLGDPQNYYEFFRLYRSPFHASTDGLFLGVLLALLFKVSLPHLHTISAHHRLQLKALFLFTILILFWLLTSHEFLAEITFYDSVIQPLLISFLFFSIALTGICLYYSQPNNPVMSWGSKLSYSVYLVHWPLIPLCLFIPGFIDLGSAETSFEAAIAYTISLWVLSFALSYIIYIFIERPVLALRKRID